MNASLQNAIRLRSEGKFDAAKAELLRLLENAPNDPLLNYHCAWTHDNLGLERQAIGFYERAIDNGLSGDDLEGALLGLGSSYRCIGEFDKAVATLTEASARFPNNKAMKVFLAMALHSAGKHSQSIETLLDCIAETSTDESINKYKRAIKFYSQNIDTLVT